MARESLETVEDLRTLFERQKAFFQKGATRDVSYRMEGLRRLQETLRRHEELLGKALEEDLGKSFTEAYLTELGIVYVEISHALQRLPRWARPRTVGTPLFLWGGKSSILPVPKGTVLIIAPWNYPVQLTLVPLVAALAAGNTAVVKPSELAPRTAAALKTILQKAFPEEWVAVVEGDAQAAQNLLDLPFDHFFFTGSQRVGRIVMEKAARHLAPVTLELGGKSPAIVHRDARLEVAARRIAWGKAMNAGQTCVAPDYLLVDEAVVEPLVEALKKEFRNLTPSLEEPGPRIINEAHFQRLKRHLEDPENGLFWGGEHDEERLRIQPALLRPRSFESPVMQEEIFGPLLPILTYREPEEARDAVLTYAPYPLALYVFSESPAVQKLFVEGVSFGGGAVNDTLVHLANPELPFGGIRHSGFGAYHGEAGFWLFSHVKSILEQSTSFDLPLRYRRDRRVLRWFRRFMR